VRVVLDPKDAHVERGEVLVAERTDPGWIMLFPLAAGLVVERGSLLSHSAIVARELRLPTVVGVAGAVSRLKTGDMIELDGATGAVRLLEAQEAAHA
jgi:pyruvate,water dikinase